MNALKKLYREGLVSKEDLESALRAHQAATNATKSPQREEADMIMAMRMSKIKEQDRMVFSSS